MTTNISPASTATSPQERPLSVALSTISVLTAVLGFCCFSLVVILIPVIVLGAFGSIQGMLPEWFEPAIGAWLIAAVGAAINPAGAIVAGVIGFFAARRNEWRIAAALGATCGVLLLGTFLFLIEVGLLWFHSIPT